MKSTWPKQAPTRGYPTQPIFHLLALGSRWARVGLALGPRWTRVGARVGLALGPWGFAFGLWGFMLGPRGFSDTNMLVSATRKYRVGGLPNARTQCEGVCVAEVPSITMVKCPNDLRIHCSNNDISGFNWNI